MKRHPTRLKSERVQEEGAARSSRGSSSRLKSERVQGASPAAVPGAGDLVPDEVHEESGAATGDDGGGEGGR